MKKIEFVEQMKILAMAYSNNYTQQELELWFEYFEGIDYQNFKEAIKEIIKINKYKPTISELLEMSNKNKQQGKFNILEKMKLNGYFKDTSEYEKAIKWLESGNIPSWFKKDMEQSDTLAIEYKPQASDPKAEEEIKQLLSEFNE